MVFLRVSHLFHYKRIFPLAFFAHSFHLFTFVLFAVLLSSTCQAQNLEDTAQRMLIFTCDR